MKISDAVIGLLVIKLGFNESVIDYFHKKTKLKNFEILKVDFLHCKVLDGKTANICLKVSIKNDRRPEYTLNISSIKLTKIKRDILISQILDI
jgi:hypothetical protein